VPLKISRALLLLDPSMYSERKISVGVVCPAGASTSAAASPAMARTMRRDIRLP